MHPTVFLLFLTATASTPSTLRSPSLTMRINVLLVFVLAVCGALLPAAVHAWGDTGHSLTGRLAMSLFSDKTTQLMKEILPMENGEIDRVSVASWSALQHTRVDTHTRAWYDSSQ